MASDKECRVKGRKTTRRNVAQGKEAAPHSPVDQSVRQPAEIDPEWTNYRPKGYPRWLAALLLVWIGWLAFLVWMIR